MKHKYKQRIYKDLTGLQFGDWIVIGPAETAEHIHQIIYYWHVVCSSCGFETTHQGMNLQKRSQVCPECRAIRTAIWESFKSYIRGAKDRDYEFTLELDEFETLIKGKCHYCGDPPSNRLRHSKRYHETFKVSGIDRKNNNLGYTLDNCVSSCTICNLGKRAHTYEEFVAWVKRLRERSILPCEIVGTNTPLQTLS